MSHSEIKRREGKIDNVVNTTVSILGFILIGYHIYTAGFGQFPPYIQRAVHLGLGIAIAYLQFSLAGPEHGPRWKTTLKLLNGFIALFAAISCGYIAISEERLSSSFDVFASPEEIIMGSGLTLLVLEAARRSTGPFLPGLALLLILYTLFGEHIPGSWGHPGFSFTYLIEELYLGTEGLWGTVTGLSANLIAIFIIFGAFLLVTGAAESFMSLAMLAAGRFPGGGAKVATVSSALFGMLNGAAVANVATTGNFTIPAMKRLGYRPAFAGAIEAAASSGGQITPPIMGAGAFVMAELLGMPYVEIVQAAIIPAFLFYACLWLSIGVEARRENMKPFDPSEIPRLSEVLHWRKIGPLVLTILVFLVSMFSGNTPELAAFYGICANLTLFLSSSSFNWDDLKSRLKKLAEGVRIARNGIVTIVALLISAQIALSLIGMTGIGIKLSEQIVSVGADAGLFVGLCLTLMVAMILGMGMPTTAAYLLAAAVTVPALTEIGVDPLAAHLFVFYSALLSALTPPVCTAVFTASIIAQEHWWPIALNSMRLAAMKYALPFFFIFRPEVLLRGTLGDIAWVVVAGVTCAFLFAIGIGGFHLQRLNTPQRVVCLAAALGLFAGNLTLDAVGIAVALSIAIWHKVNAAKHDLSH